VLLDLESKYFYALNASGWAIVQLFESGISVDAAQAQARAWAAPDDGRIEHFIAQLQRYGLLESARPLPDEPKIEWHGPWTAPSIERQAEPLQNIMVSAFDPSIPLAE
jgi:Coenzyme PQQ synthesis protein D (PqqD)